jgi:hypothetical protein
MKYFLTPLILLLINIGFSQTQVTLERNNVKAFLSTSGHFFNNSLATASGYEIPKGSGNNAIFSNSFWFGGSDANGASHIAAQDYFGDQDFWTGPLSTFGGVLGQYGDAEITAAQIAYYDQVWQISAAEIQNHIQNYNTIGYTPISSIATWPAHGDVSLGQAYYLAPFVDVNLDGDYNPVDGDYPNIRGDEAAYMILNDKGGVHTSSGEAIGLELHIMAYQYESNDFLNNTTFVNIRFVNRSTQTIFDFKFGNFIDADLGNGGDDYMGTNPSKNLVYAYNGYNSDSQYGISPPAIGVMTLCSPMISANYFNSSNIHTQIPNTPAGYLGFLNGQWGSSGLGFTQGGNGFGGTVPTNYIYNDLDLWSELTEGNFATDRKMLMTVDPIQNQSQTLSPGYQGNIDLAFVYARDSTHVASVEALFSVADSVQDFFNTTFVNPCEDGFLEVDNKPLKSFDISLFPNPTLTSYRIIGVEGEVNIEVYDITGKLVMSHFNINASQPLASPDKAGIYLVTIQQKGRSTTVKLIVE